MKVVGVRSGDLQSFRLGDANCNQVKRLAEFDGQLAVGPRAVRSHKIQQTPFLARWLHFKQFRRPIGQFENGDVFLQVALVGVFMVLQVVADCGLPLSPLLRLLGRRIRR